VWLTGFFGPIRNDDLAQCATVSTTSTAGTFSSGEAHTLLQKFDRTTTKAPADRDAGPSPVSRLASNSLGHA